MRLQKVLSKVEVWRNQVLAACEPRLAQARMQMADAQMAPDADSLIARQEELLTGALEDVLTDAEVRLDVLRDEVALFFETADDPDQQEQDAADQVDRASDALRDWLLRKVASIVAQARARELPSGAIVERVALQQAVAAPPPAAIRPVAQGRPTRVGYGSPEEIAERYGPPPVPVMRQAPAPELAEPPKKRFCTECGGPLAPDALGARRCPNCGRGF